MKKILLVVLPLICVSFLMASHLTPMEFNEGLNLMYGGELRARVIMNNDLDENDGGWFDNRLQFNLAAKLSKTTSVFWGAEVGDIHWRDFGNLTPALETRELYIDYKMDWMDLSIRTGQQYWHDHRALILDDYYSGISADLTLAGIPTELGFIKSYEGALNKLDVVFKTPVHVASFANFVFKTPVDWGLTAMFGQNHDTNEADFWVIPYFMLNFEPITLDLTAVINQQMWKDALGEDDSQMGMAFAANLGMEAGVKLGVDFLYVTEEGICTLSPYYVNGLYLFGNQLPYDGVQISSGYDDWAQAYMSIVGSASYPLNDMMEIYGAVGMASVDDPIGMEFNVGVDYRINNFLSFNPVLAVGQSGKAIDADENMVYMLGGLLKAEF